MAVTRGMVALVAPTWILGGAMVVAVLAGAGEVATWLFFAWIAWMAVSFLIALALGHRG